MVTESPGAPRPLIASTADRPTEALARAPAIHVSRRRFLLASAAGAAAGGLALAGIPVLAASPGPAAPQGTVPSPAPATPAPATPAPTPSGPPADAIVHYRSRPDLRPPVISVQASQAAGEDLLFVTPRFSGQGEGVMLMDAGGRLVWLHRVPGRSAAALRPVRYRGSPAMAWWEGAIERGLGDGEFVIVDDRYREQARVRTVRHPADLHELLITPQDTAYAFAMDLVELDGRLVDDMLVQEVDIATGRLLWEWRASDHIRPEESSEPAPEEGPWDYLHFNSIDRDLDGDLLLSARHTDALYRVSRRTGDIVWRLGGKGSDFELPEDVVFRKQHDARRHEDGTISLFDNATKDPEDTVRPRGLVLRLDEAARTVELVRQLVPPHDIVSSSQGNLSVAADGSATIGWGSANLVTGYDAAGEVVFDAAMPDGFSSYRAYRARLARASGR